MDLDVLAVAGLFLLGVVIVIAVYYLLWLLPEDRRSFWSKWFVRTGLLSVIIGGLFGTVSYYGTADLLKTAGLFLSELFALFLAHSFIPLKDSTILHLLARILAPCLSLHVLYHLNEEKGRQLLNKLFTSFRRKIVVFGFNERSAALIRSLDPKDVCILFTDKELSAETRLQLLKQDVIIKQTGSLDDKQTLRMIGNVLNERRLKEIYLLEDDETIDLDLAAALLDLSDKLKLNKQITLYVGSLGDPLAERLVDHYRSKSAFLKEHLDLRVFNDSERQVFDMLKKEAFYEPVAAYLEKKKAKTVKNILSPHILIGGLNELGLMVLSYVLRTAILSPRQQKTKVTLLDSGEVMDKILVRFPQIREVVDLVQIRKDGDDPVFISELAKDRPLTYAVLCYQDKALSYRCLEILGSYLDEHGLTELNVPLFVRADHDRQSQNDVIASAYNRKDQNHTVRSFGQLARLYDHKYLQDAEVEKQAQAFMHSYRHAFRKNTDAPSSWRELSYFERQSAITESFYASYIYAIGEDLNMVNRSMRNELRKQIVKVNKDKAIVQYWKDLRRDHKALSELIELEHLRHQAFYYALGYAGAIKDVPEHSYGTYEEDDKSCFGKSSERLLPIDKLRSKGYILADGMRHLLLYLREDPETEDR